MKSFKVTLLLALSVYLVQGRPQHSKGFIPQQVEDEEDLGDFNMEVEEPAPTGFVPVREIVSYRTGEVIPVNQDSLDVNGCVVGPAGERNCPNGAFGAGNDRVTFRGNKGPGYTGSNGNAGPIDEAGRPIDPAAQTYLKQIEAYKLWEKQQEENNKKIIG